MRVREIDLSKVWDRKAFQMHGTDPDFIGGTDIFTKSGVASTLFQVIVKAKPNHRSLNPNECHYLVCDYLFPKDPDEMLVKVLVPPNNPLIRTTSVWDKYHFYINMRSGDFESKEVGLGKLSQEQVETLKPVFDELGKRPLPPEEDNDIPWSTFC